MGSSTTSKSKRVIKRGNEWLPHDYQKVAVRWLINHPEAALFLDPGLGKTSITLSAFQALKRARKVERLLVIAPLRPCYDVWSHSETGELKKWSNFKDLTVTLLHGPKKEDRLNEDSDIYVINHDGLRWLNEKGRMKKLLKKGAFMLAIDELSAMKNARSLRDKSLKPWLGRFVRRCGLTGTPAANGLLDLFGQVLMLDMGKRLGSYITHYRMKYFNPTGFKGYKWEPQEGAEKKIYRALKDLALPMKAEDYLDIPKHFEREIYVTLPTKVMKRYKQLEDEFMTAVSDGIITAANAGVASGKLRQIASGRVYADEDMLSLATENDTIGVTKRRVHDLHDEKIKAMRELVDELQHQPLLVGYQFDHDRDALVKAFPHAEVICGGTAMKKSSRIVAAWCEGEVEMLVAHPAAMAHGLNLQTGGHHIAWYSPPWNFEHYDQFNRRLHRQGQKRKVFNYRIVTRGTVDEVVVATLTKKDRTQRGLIEGLKALRKARKR